MNAGIRGASARSLVGRALRDPTISDRSVAPRGGVATVIAAGKAAMPMAMAFTVDWPGLVETGLVAAPTGGADVGELEAIPVGHPVPDAGSVAAGRRALDLARAVPPDGLLIVLLSGGASAALVVPSPGVTLAAKIDATQAMLDGGLAIGDINCVRKHLSAVKGGWLAAASAAPVVTLAISDVVGPRADDPAVIGSGPSAPDPTSFEDALRVVGHPALRRTFPIDARRTLERGLRGEVPETPGPGDPRLRRSVFHVIGNRLDAMRAAAQRATGLGYHVVTRAEPVIGPARDAGGALVTAAAAQVRMLPRPACLLSSGETTVEVRGSGRGGRNQELALAAAKPLREHFSHAVMASVGTDGVDGPTDAAGAVVDTATVTRATAKRFLGPDDYLDRNDSYTFFDQLDDLVKIGPTETNVGDLQVMLIG